MARAVMAALLLAAICAVAATATATEAADSKDRWQCSTATSSDVHHCHIQMKPQAAVQTLLSATLHAAHCHLLV